jgi:hypothetical protein
MSEVSTFVSADFSQSVTVDGPTNNANARTLNYRWYPDASSVYTWQSYPTSTDTYFRLFSNNTQRYTTDIRTFDELQYGLVTDNDDINSQTGEYNSRIIVNGSSHSNETLIIAIGLYGFSMNETFTLTGQTSSVWLQPNSPPISNICFPSGTHITTNQGTIPIEKINKEIHTIRNKKIVGITQTITQDKYLVCFEKDSLGINLPSQKTIISKNHCIVYKA